MIDSYALGKEQVRSQIACNCLFHFEPKRCMKLILLCRYLIRRIVRCKTMTIKCGFELNSFDFATLTQEFKF